MKRARLRKFLLIGLAVVAVCLVAAFAFLRTQPFQATALEKCQKISDGTAEACYQHIIDKTLSTQGLPKTLALMKRIASQNSHFGIYCHNIMHAVGSAAYKDYRKTKKIDISEDLSTCHFGFYHGFMEEMYGETGSMNEAQDFCSLVNTQLKDQPYALSNCYHGIGHGLTDGTNQRTWGDAKAMAAPGIALCHSISPNGELRRSCETGVFNSIELLYFDPKYKLDFSGDPFQLCKVKGYDEVDKQSCYIQMSVLANTIAPSYADTIRYARMSEKSFHNYAIRYLTLFAVVQKDVPTPDALFAACKKAEPKFAYDCMYGTVQGLLVYSNPTDKYASSIAFCSSKLAASDKAACVHTVLITDVSTPQESKRICARLPADLREGQCTL